MTSCILSAYLSSNHIAIYLSSIINHPLLHHFLCILLPSNKTPLHLLQRPPLRLGHPKPTNNNRQRRAPSKQKVRGTATFRQKNRRNQRNKEIRHPVTSMRKTRRARSRPLGLDLRRVDLTTHTPGHTVNSSEEIDRDDDDPATSAGRMVDCVGGVQGADYEHGYREPETAEDDVAAAAPGVGVDEGRNGHDEDDDAGDAGGEEAGL